MSNNPDLPTDSSEPTGSSPTDIPGTAKAPHASDARMTRSAEELRISTSRRETQRARLVTFVETQEKTFAVPVRREQVRIEYLPVEAGSTGSAGLGGKASPPGEQWVVLYDEEVVMQKRWVARERVRLVVHAVTEDRQISADLRHEELAINDTTDGD